MGDFTEEISKKVPKLNNDSTLYATLKFFIAFKQVCKFMNWKTAQNSSNKTMLFVLTIEDGKMIKKRKFERQIKMFCGGNCWSIAGEDFWFTDNETIQYYRIDPELLGVDASSVLEEIKL